MVERKEITIFCDGSCYAKHPEKLGGFGVYIQKEEGEFWISKGYSNTTISRMEFRAILYAIQSIEIDIRSTVMIYSDSQYVVNTIKEKGFDWENGSLKGCANYDLIDRVFKEIELHKKSRIKLTWIPGHRKRYDDPIVTGNYIADQLADYKNHETYYKDNAEEKPYLYSNKKGYDPRRDPNFIEECEGMVGDIY